MTMNTDIVLWIIAALLAVFLMRVAVRRYRAGIPQTVEWMKEEGYIERSPEECRQKRLEEAYKRLAKE